MENKDKETTSNYPLEIRRNKDGSLDEIVCSGAFVHLAQMDSNYWWMMIEKDGQTVHVNFFSKQPISVLAEKDDES